MDEKFIKIWKGIKSVYYHLNRNKDRYCIGFLCFILGIFTTMIFLFLVGFIAWWRH